MNTELLMTVGSFVNTAIFVLTFWRLGANRASSEVIATYKEQVVALKDEVNRFKDKVDSLTKELFTQKGAVAEKDKQIQSLQMVLQGRDPQQEQTMKFINDVASKANDFMSKQTNDIQEIKNLLKKKGGKHGR